MSETDDVARSFHADERAALEREIGELRERLAAQGAKQCASCGAVFQGGEGRVVMADGKRKPKGEGDDELAALRKQKAALEKELAEAKAGASSAPAAPQQPASDDDEGEGFGFFD